MHGFYQMVDICLNNLFCILQITSSLEYQVSVNNIGTQRVERDKLGSNASCCFPFLGNKSIILISDAFLGIGLPTFWQFCLQFRSQGLCLPQDGLTHMLFYQLRTRVLRSFHWYYHLLFPRHQQLDEPWPAHAYTSHICRFDVFPRFDPESSKIDGKT